MDTIINQLKQLIQNLESLPDVRIKTKKIGKPADANLLAKMLFPKMSSAFMNL